MKKKSPSVRQASGKDSMSSKNIEEGKQIHLDFEKLHSIALLKEPLIPVVAQENRTKEVLVIAYANREALRKTLETKIATFYSTSRNQLWVKGDTSGDYLDLVEVRVNCEQNSLLYLVEARTGSSCHTKNKLGKRRTGCFYRRIAAGNELEFTQPE